MEDCFMFFRVNCMHKVEKSKIIKTWGTNVGISKTT